MPRRQVLLIDVPVVPVRLPTTVAPLVRRKLSLEAEVRHFKLPGVVCPTLPYSRGLLTIASAAKATGADVSYIVWSDTQDRRRIPDLVKSADLIGITCMTSGSGVATQIALEARSLNPSCAIVLGGPHATALGALVLEQMPAVDAVVLGDGWKTIAAIIADLTCLDQIPGVATRKFPDAVPRRESYLEAPLPAYELLFRPLAEYAHSVRTADGCPYGCMYCAERRSTRLGASRELEAVFAELARLFQELPTGTLLHFSDPVFNINPGRTKNICEFLAEHGRAFYFSIDTRPDLITSESVDVLSHGGCRYVRIGVESLQDSILTGVKRDVTRTSIDNALNVLQSTAPSILTHAYWITGLPGVDHESAFAGIEQAGSLVDSGAIDVLSNKVMVPYPGTAYYKDPSRFGINLLGRQWHQFDRLSPPVYSLRDADSSAIYEWFRTTEARAVSGLEARLSTTNIGPRSWQFETYKGMAYVPSDDVVTSDAAEQGPEVLGTDGQQE